MVKESLCGVLSVAVKKVVSEAVHLEKVAFIFTYVERGSKSLHSPWFDVCEYQKEND